MTQELPAYLSEYASPLTHGTRMWLPYFSAQPFDSTGLFHAALSLKPIYTRSDELLVELENETVLDMPPEKIHRVWIESRRMVLPPATDAENVRRLRPESTRLGDHVLLDDDVAVIDDRNESS